LVEQQDLEEKAMIRWTFVPIVVTSCIIGLHAQGEPIKHTEGRCSPIIENVSGNVTVTCLDPQVTKLFLDYINAQNKSFENKAKEVQLWIDRYNALRSRLDAATAFEVLRDQVKVALDHGDFARAEEAQKKIVEQQEKSVDQAADDLYNLAEMLVLNLRPKEAQDYYARAFQYRPFNPVIAEGYARSLCDSGEVAKARDLYKLSSEQLKDRVAAGDSHFIPNLACMLINLGGIYFDAGEYVLSYEAALEAKGFAERIKPTDGEVAREHVADSLTGIGISLAKLRRSNEAVSALQEADAIFYGLGKITINRAIVGQALGQLAAIRGEMGEAERHLKRSTEISRALATGSALGFRSILARVTDELFQLYLTAAKLAEAAELRDETLSFVTQIPEREKPSSIFLNAFADDMSARLQLQQGMQREARKSAMSSTVAFAAMETQLRPKESSLYAGALNTLGWINMIDGEYNSGHSNFERAVKVNRFRESPKAPSFARDHHIAAFFVKPFAEAVADISPSLPLGSDQDEPLWRVLRRVRETSNLPLDLSLLNTQIERDLIEIAFSQAPAQRLNAFVKSERCKLAFFTGVIASISKRPSQAEEIFAVCTRTSRDDPYSWLVAALKRNGL
jgi:tetratricopeptide (TPR) repeat protein